MYLYEQDRPRRKVAVKVLVADLKTDGARRRFEAEAMRRQGVPEAPRIESLPETLDLNVLPAAAPGQAIIGVDDYNLEPAELAANGALMLAGPPGSGRTTALVTLGEALKRSTPATHRVYLGSRKSAVASMPVWDEAFTTNNGVEPELARLLELVESETQEVALFIEGVTEFADFMLEMDLVNLIKAASKLNYLVVGRAVKLQVASTMDHER